MLALTYLEFQEIFDLPFFWPLAPILVLLGIVIYLKAQDFEYTKGQVILLVVILLLIIGLQLFFHFVLDESMGRQSIIKIAFDLVLLILEIWLFAADRH